MRCTILVVSAVTCINSQHFVEAVWSVYFILKVYIQIVQCTEVCLEVYEAQIEK